MISYINGKIILNKSIFVIVNVSGVGYKIFVPANYEIEEDKNSSFFIHQHIREDASDLYGFKTYEELEVFEKLLSVNGVGPKVAILILSVSDTSKIIRAIINSDTSFFCSVPGIGKKVASKIIIDLKTKFGAINTDIDPLDSDSSDYIDALVSLGYKKSDITKTINKIPEDLKTSEEKVRWFLKNNIK